MYKKSVVILSFVALAATASAEKITFNDHIKSIFQGNCNKCHNPDKAKGGLDLSTYHAMLAGGSSGAVVEPGNPDGSYLLALITHQDEPFMPPKSPMRPASEIDLIKKWIAGGLLESASSIAMVAKKPKFEFKLDAASTGKPEGPPPMPQDLLLEPIVLTEKANAVTAVASSPWAPVVAVGGQKQVILYHSETFEPAGILAFPEGVPTILKFSRNGKLLLAGGGTGAKSGRVVVWSVETGDRVIEVGEDFDTILAADISSDHAFIATGGPDKYVNIYSTEDGSRMHHIKKHTEWITALEFSPDGVLLATGDRNGGMHVWETFTGQEFYKLGGHKETVTDISWRLDSNAVASSSEDDTIKLWNLHNGGQIKSWNAHGGGVLSMEYARNGNIVSCGRDQVAKLWDGNGGGKRTYEKIGDVATSVMFNHDGTRVILGGWTGEVNVWNAEDGKKLGQLSANPPSLAQRIVQTEKQIKDLEGPFQKLVEAEKAAAAAAQNLVNELNGMKAQTAESQKVLTMADQHLASTKKALESVSSAMNEGGKQVAARRTELEAAEKNLAGKSDELNKVRMVVQKAEADLAAKTKDDPVGKAKAAIEAERKKVQDLEKQQAAARVQEQAKIPPHTDAFNKAKAEHDKAVAQVDTARKGLEGKVEAELEKAKAALVEVEKLVAPAKTKMDQVKAQLDQAQKALQDFIAKQPEALKLPKENLAKAEAHLKTVEQGIQAAQNTVNAEKAKVPGIEQQVAQMKTASDAAKAKLAEAEKMVSARQAAVDVAKNEIAKAEQARQKAAADHEAKTNTMKAKDVQVAEANKKAGEAKAAMEKGKPDLAPLHRQLALWKASQFNIKVHGLRKEWKEKEARHNALLEAAKVAQQEAKQEKSRYEQLRAEYEKLKPKS